MPRTEVPQSQLATFNVTDFDEAINHHGIRLVHFRAMRCPVGLVDLGDGRRPDHDHSGCSNGHLYTRAGTLRALFSGNSDAHHMTQVGLIDGATVRVTVQRYYENEDSEPICNEESEVHVANFDRVYLEEAAITVPTSQLFRAHITGREKLQFPVVKVFDIVDSSGKRYSSDDYDVVSGYLQWVGDRPAPDAVCAVRYTYRPYWYVKQLMHQVRVVRADNYESGERGTVRMPQEMLLQREFIFEKEDKDPLAPDPTSASQVKSPRDGSFGAR